MPTLKIVAQDIPGLNDGAIGSITVSEADWPDVQNALFAHPSYGFVTETKTVEVEEGVDQEGNPILVEREVTTRNPATIEQAMQSYADKIKQDVIDGANTYRKAVIEAKKAAEAKAAFKPIVTE